jgi:hypothetical protein
MLGMVMRRRPHASIWARRPGVPCVDWTPVLARHAGTGNLTQVSTEPGQVQYELVRQEDYRVNLNSGVWTTLR